MAVQLADPKLKDSTPRKPKEPKEVKAKETKVSNDNQPVESETEANGEKTKKRKPRAKKPKQKTTTEEGAEAVEPKAPKPKAKKEFKFFDHILYVGNLPYQVNDENLKAVFDMPGVKSAKIVTGLQDKSKGYGYVEFTDAAVAKSAMDKFEGALLDDRKLKISYARDNVKL